MRLLSLSLSVWLDWTASDERDPRERSRDRHSSRNNCVIEDAREKSLELPYVMSITKYDDYAFGPGYIFRYFYRSTYSRVEYCTGSTEKTEFMRNPTAARRPRHDLCVCIRGNMELNIQSLRKELGISYNSNFILIVIFWHVWEISLCKT